MSLRRREPVPISAPVLVPRPVQPTEAPPDPITTFEVRIIPSENGFEIQVWKVNNRQQEASIASTLGKRLVGYNVKKSGPIRVCSDPTRNHYYFVAAEINTGSSVDPAKALSESPLEGVSGMEGLWMPLLDDRVIFFTKS